MTAFWSSEDFRRFSKIVQRARRTSPNIFREFLKISEDVRRFPKIAEDFRWCTNEFKRETWYQWNHRYLRMWGYCVAFINLFSTRHTTDFYKKSILMWFMSTEILTQSYCKFISELWGHSSLTVSFFLADVRSTKGPARESPSSCGPQGPRSSCSLKQSGSLEFRI